jgi:hypothetical protein
MASVRVWVDPEFQKALKKQAADAELTLIEFTKRVAHGKQNKNIYEWPY